MGEPTPQMADFEHVLTAVRRNIVEAESQIKMHEHKIADRRGQLQEAEVWLKIWQQRLRAAEQSRELIQAQAARAPSDTA